MWSGAEREADRAHLVNHSNDGELVELTHGLSKIACVSRALAAL
jgi:hypothetical protein